MIIIFGHFILEKIKEKLIKYEFIDKNKKR